jgi:hypothetical protein
MSREALSPPSLSAGYLEEPVLRFCSGLDVDPRTGLTNFGPFSLSQPRKHPRSARVALLGTPETCAAAQTWMQECARGVDGEGTHPNFPGFMRDAGFFVDLIFDESWNAEVTRRERETVLALRGERARFEACLALLDDKLAWLGRQDRPPEYVVLALPDELVERCGVADYKDEEGREVHRDLRRALKVSAMKYALPTQLLRERTVRGGKGVDHKAKCAWNFFTAMYFKLGAIPWAPVGLDPDTCFVGVSFFRPLGSKNRMQASIAQAFNGRGDALVLRGEEFPWEPTRKEKSPHLDADMARRLIEHVVKRYVEETQEQPPRRVVIHKTSRFTPEEARGFSEGLRGVPRYDLLAVTPRSDVRLLRNGKYPVLRGTHFKVGRIEYLYTTGFLPALGEFPHGHVPSPLQIADHQGGDTPTLQLLREVLALTKMNWNSSDFGGLKPVTLAFAELVGEILREVPSELEPLRNFKYYV